MPRLSTFVPLGLLVREAFLTPQECRDIGLHMRSQSGEQATIFGESSTGTIAIDVRRAWEVSVPRDCQTMIAQRLEALRPALESHFAIGLDSADEPSFVRYPAGAFYRAHRDRRESPDSSGAHRRAVSVVIFVNSPQDEFGFSGGQLRFYGLLGDGPLADIGLDAEPQGGTLIAFPSTVVHEVTTVEEGVRLSIVTWFAERPPELRTQN